MDGLRPRTHFEAGRVLALDPFVKASRFDVGDFFQGVFKHLNADGKQFAVPQYVNANHVYYNREHFRRASRSPRGTGRTSSSWTPPGA